MACIRDCDSLGEGSNPSIPTNMKWFCKRCETVVDYEAFKCECKTSPSPWIPLIEYSMERVEIKPGSRKILKDWTIEFDPPIWDCSDEWKESMEKDYDM